MSLTVIFTFICMLFAINFNHFPRSDTIVHPHDLSILLKKPHNIVKLLCSSNISITPSVSICLSYFPI